MSLLGFVIFIIFVALVFDFFNGFHDAANSIATLVSTRVLTPVQAVVWAAVCNFIAAFLLGTKVADTIGKGLIVPEQIDIYVVLAGLTAAIAWNVITWLLGLPTSSSHALVGGLAGAAVAKAGIFVLLWKGWIPLLAFIILSPLLGFILGLINMSVVTFLARGTHPNKADKIFRNLQFVSAGIYSIGHGGNDAQKTMGIIVMLLTATGYHAATEPDHTSWLNSMTLFGQTHSVAPWIILSCQAAITVGTLFGGWRIVRTMGSGITRLQPVGGFAATGAAATTILAATHWGIPVSTTHAITGAIMGVGTTRGVRRVRWIWGQRIVMAWVLTIPCSAAIAAVAWWIIHLTIERIPLVR